ncbi:MarR family winged helix-turn-helix transcriptional regulator [Zhongshania sp.]|uniref:MarR family winged helix-turn-helix transcriptional regulator n=1 Tax=Zhongshania sp. TaxID=1971902 RepID=UPI0035615978
MKIDLSATPPKLAQLQLENQLCFPLYASSRLITRLYQRYLTPLGLTYPQYIVMMILWEHAPCSINVVGDKALLNTNTLTPLLKRLEQQGFIHRRRADQDGRMVLVHLSDAGVALQDACSEIPEKLAAKLGMSRDSLLSLKALLDEILPALCLAVET